MTLEQFLSTLKSTNILAKINDLEDNEVAKVYTNSYRALDDDILARTVARWYVHGATAIQVVLNDPRISA